MNGRSIFSSARLEINVISSLMVENNILIKGFSNLLSQNKAKIFKFCDPSKEFRHLVWELLV